ncbi:HlyD family type I secretion periplasmic adaptor subunit [Falsirhodobacter sp. alg1]|uniref:HlyD family type I secretion periplasmic adaptor subunit n=1 Tax=Falsirhodobacter sp. alg1 TaxID=1472418 RepID=UPI000789085A|nr:HlyD family type I secretion periplasmic adaptor subunit [Falsirhodobacter sp. alg1]
MSWSVRPLAMTGFATIATLGVVLGAWGGLARLDGAVVAMAEVRVERDRQIVQHPDGGVVAEIAVKEGQSVTEGQLLLRLDGNALRSELFVVEAQLFEIMARADRLDAERDGADRIIFADDLLQASRTNPEIRRQMEGQTRLFDARRETLARQIDQIHRRQEQTGNEIEGLTAQRTALDRQADLIGRELEDQRILLSKGLTQVSRVMALEREAARLTGEQGGVDAQKAEAQGRITEFGLEELRLTAARREDAISQTRDFAYQRMELQERRRALTQKIADLDVRAPVAGVVLGLTVTTPRAVVRPADPILYLIPQDRALVLEARIPPRNIDEVRTGQSVRIVLPSFPMRNAPDVEGAITSVSADTLRDDRGAPYYRAEVALDSGTVPASLVPGMPAEVFVRTGSRTPLAYLLRPFAVYFDRALRES